MTRNIYLSSLSNQRVAYGIPSNSAIFFLMRSPFLWPCITYVRYCLVIPILLAKSACLIPIRTSMLLIRRVLGWYFLGLELFFCAIMFTV